jgi:hypothetical protein
MSRRRQLRIGGIALAVLLVAGALTAYFVTRPNPAAIAGCSSVRTISPYPGGNDRTHITSGSLIKTPPPLSTYPSTPPASGPHDPSPLDAGVYSQPPDVYRAIHALEHAAVIIWYRPGTQNAELNRIISYYSDPTHNDHVIVAPYSYPSQGKAGSLPAGAQMVLVAWHHLQDCPRFSLAAVQDYVKHYRVTTGSVPGLSYKGDAPEAGLAI